MECNWHLGKSGEFHELWMFPQLRQDATKAPTRRSRSRRRSRREGRKRSRSRRSRKRPMQVGWVQETTGFWRVQKWEPRLSWLENWGLFVECLIPSRCIFCRVLFVQAEPKEQKPQKQPRQVKVGRLAFWNPKYWEECLLPIVVWDAQNFWTLSPLWLEGHRLCHGARLARLDFMIWFSRCQRAQMVMLPLSCFWGWWRMELWKRSKIQVPYSQLHIQILVPLPFHHLLLRQHNFFFPAQAPQPTPTQLPGHWTLGFLGC